MASRARAPRRKAVPARGAGTVSGGPPARGAGEGNPTATGLNMGSLGELGLNAIREPAMRAARLAERLFDAPDADVIAVNDGRVWRAKPAGPFVTHDSARFLALSTEQSLWVADATVEPGWRDHPAVLAAGGMRFCAAAPIRLRDGSRVGVIRVIDSRPHPFDSMLAQGLEDLAAFLGDESDRFLGGETRLIRALFDRAPGLMAVTRGPEHVFELANPAYRHFHGDRDLIGQPFIEALPGSETQGVRTLLDQVFKTGVAYSASARPIFIRRAPEGPPAEVYADFVLQPIRDGAGDVTGIFIQGHDVTDAKLAADALAASQAELQSAISAIRTVFDRSLDVICTIDKRGRFTSVSPRAETLWGYAPAEMVGRPLTDFIHPDDIAATRAVAGEIRSGRPTKSFTNRYIHKDGATVPVMWSAVWSEVHELTFGIGRDMREHEAAEEKLRQAQKMEALGRLTGGVAHDFNNLLTVVIGSAEALTEGLADQQKLQPFAQLILDAAENGAELINRLLAFSRRQSLTPQTQDSDGLFRSLLPMLRRTIGADIEIDMTSEADLRWVADPTQLTSALLNLCLNARDAMPDGGKLTISARRVRDAEAESGAFIVLCVEDTGHGMTPETIQRVLEPFFTTKPVGKGSGLGLSMVYGFALQSGGRLKIESEPGRGARICLYLPEASAAPVSPQAPPQAQRVLALRRILLVEDDDSVRIQAERQLTALGYQVTAASNGVEALQLLVDTPGIDLLMTDIVMPGGLNGRQVAAEARARLPSLPIVFTSGYSDAAQLSAARLVSNSAFLPKPYRRADLARVLEEAFEDA